jgi:diguanylate cyclase (GGDEF)-like protein
VTKDRSVRRDGKTGRFSLARWAGFWLGLLTAIPAGAAPPAHNAAFDASAGVIELKGALAAYHPPGVKPDDTLWYAFTAVNNSGQPAVRIVHAGETPCAGLDVLPRPGRPALVQVTSPNSGVAVERVRDYGRRDFRIDLPPHTSAPVAVQVEGASAPPSILAWTEPALAAHNRWMAIYIAAVAGLITAAAAIASGLAFLTHRAEPRWAALMLAAMLMARLSEIGLFDGSLVIPFGGPYGLVALFVGLGLAAGLRLADAVLPVKEILPRAERWLRWTVYGVVGFSALAYLGMPAATLTVDTVAVLAALAVVAYVIWRGYRGTRVARALAPAAVMFALFGLTAAATALGGFGDNPLMPDIAGGFAAAGALLLTLSMAAGEGLGVFSFVRPIPVPAAPMPQPLAPPPPPHAAIEAIGASFQGVFEHDLAKGTVTLSAEASRLLGFSGRAHRMRHAVWMKRIHPDDRPIYAQAVEDFGAKSDIAFRIEFRARCDDGNYQWFELRATMKGPEDGPAVRCVGLLADVTTRKESEAAASDRNTCDPLTGLGNRVALMEALEALGSRLNRAVYALIDIDRFKTICASLGQEGGDKVLSLAAQRLIDRFGKTADIFRIGGDAFAVLVEKAEAETDALGAELVELCAAAHHWNDRSIFAPVSVGIALGKDASDPLNLINNAEMALRIAKRQGGGAAKTYAPGMEAQAPADAVALEADLRRALEDGAIEVFYQPIVRLSDRSVAGFEALLRWHHTDRGLLSPEDFIAHSEATGLIVALGRLALRNATAHLAEWQRFFPLAEALFVSVNLSRRQLFDSELEDDLKEAIAKSGIKPGSLVLEVTESAVAAPDGLSERFVRLRDIGARLAIDDFGTGLSNLSQLGEIPFDTVKIDKCFLKHRDQDGDTLLSSMISLAKELNRRVVVEGVEREEDAVRLKAMGCELAQGFLFAEPMPAREALQFIARTFRSEDAASEHSPGSRTP